MATIQTRDVVRKKALKRFSSDTTDTIKLGTVHLENL